ncbi:MAG: insulinase family protein [Clostridiales Family XIII bacterium]|jgi:predicted Zn-dependent peptidase|nr:insulinase family protein [Clostridiales Family XIII bacterium]
MIKTKTLNCGIRLVTEELPHVKSVSAGVWVRAGAVRENARQAGISHFIEHMLFKGTAKRTAKQLAEDVDRIGGQINAFTGKEATCYYLKTLSANFAKGAEILSDMLLASKLDRAEADKERQVIMEEIKMIEDSPEDDIHDLICEQIFRGASLSKSVIGSPSTLVNIKPATMRAYMRRLYTSGNIVLAVAGGFDAAEVEREAERLFSALPGGLETLTPDDCAYVPRHRSKVKDIEQSHICMGVRGVALEDARYYSLMLLNNIMGGGMSARFFQNIREQKGLAYAVYSSASSFTSDGLYSIYAAVGHDKVKEAAAAVLFELARLKKDGITRDEFHTAKEQMKSQYIFAQENVNGRMFAIGKNYLLLNRVFTPEEILEKIDGVTWEEIHETAGLITDPARYSAAVIGRRRRNWERLLRDG